MRLRPGYPDAFTGMGVSLKELRRHDEAAVCFRAVVQLRPGCALSLGNLAGLYYEQVPPPPLPRARGAPAHTASGCGACILRTQSAAVQTDWRQWTVTEVAFYIAFETSLR